MLKLSLMGRAPEETSRGSVFKSTSENRLVHFRSSQEMWNHEIAKSNAALAPFTMNATPISMSIIALRIIRLEALTLRERTLLNLRMTSQYRIDNYRRNCSGNSTGLVVQNHHGGNRAGPRQEHYEER